MATACINASPAHKFAPQSVNPAVRFRMRLLANNVIINLSRQLFGLSEGMKKCNGISE